MVSQASMSATASLHGEAVAGTKRAARSGHRRTPDRDTILRATERTVWMGQKAERNGEERPQKNTGEPVRLSFLPPGLGPSQARFFSRRVATFCTRTCGRDSRDQVMAS